MRLDKKTVFYDVFVDGQTRKLHALGPRLLNLKQELLPLIVSVNGSPIVYRLDDIHHLTFLESKNPIDDSSETVTVEFRFRPFTQTVTVDWRTNEKLPQSFSDSALTISTLQKDNPFEWIRDWILWHCRLYGVGRVVLYDNGSSNQDELVSRLRELEHEVKIIFIDWSFPHGNKPNYAQFGSLNHARMQFPVHGAFCINLDIDEYLVMPGGGSLLDYLERKLADPTLGAVTFTQYIVPNIPHSEPDGISRCFDFPYRFRNAGRTGSKSKWSEIMRMKYIYHFDKVGYNGPHRTASEKNTRFLRRYGVFRYIKHYVMKCLRAPINRLTGYSMPKTRIDSCHASKQELYFLHFQGLNTGWRTRQAPQRTSFDKDRHVEDPLIAELADKANLRSS